MKKTQKPQLFLHTIAIVYAILCIIPFVIVISASLTSPLELSQEGYSLWPDSINLNAYTTIFEHPETILRSYEVTIFVTAATVLFGLLLMSMAAFTLARQNCSFRRPLSFFF